MPAASLLTLLQLVRISHGELVPVPPWQDKDPEMALLNAEQQNASQSCIMIFLVFS